MSGFAIRANERFLGNHTAAAPAGEVGKPEEIETPPRDAKWFKEELVRRGVKGNEIICGDYLENFDRIPSHLLEAYLERRPRMLHRTALEEVLAADTKR
jgi:hypothetical protein